MNTHRRRQVSLFVIIYFITVTVVSAISTPIYWAHETQRISVLKEREIGYINNTEQLIKSELSKALADLGLIGGLPFVHASLREGSPESFNNVATLFARLAEGYGRYDQIRILSLTGQEMIRVNYNDTDGNSTIVEEPALQDKSDPYFDQTVARFKPGSIFISEIGPSQENGVTGIPYQPVLRLGTMLFDPDSGQIFGILVLNLRVQYLLDNFNQLMSEKALHQGYLIDRWGNWLTRPGADYNALFSEGTIPFRDEFPELWQEMQQQPSGFFAHEQGLYIFRSVAADSLINFTVTPKRFSTTYRIPDNLNELLNLNIVVFLSNQALHATSFLYQPLAKWVFSIGALVHALVVWGFVALYLRNREQKIREGENTSELERLYDLAPCGYMSVKDSQIININATLAKWLGYEKDEIIGQLEIRQLMTHEALDNLTRRGEELARQHFILDDTEDLVRKDGTLLPVSLSASVEVDSSGHWDVARVSVVDITDRRVKEQLLEAKANTDDLSGLYNRRQFFNLAEIEISRTRRHKQAVSLMLLDVDKFKDVNDTYGHNSGDLVLIALANEITDALRAEDILARYGGEEFIVMLPATGLTVASEVAERIRQKIESTPVHIENNRELNITISIGISQWDETDHSIDDVINRADLALYAAKSGGRNLVRYQLKRVNEGES